MTKQTAAAKPTKALAFYLAAGRPGSGERLFAHTFVALDRSGMLTGAAMPTSTMRKVMGDTAVAYHKRQGNIVSTEQGYALTPQGLHVFTSRNVNEEYRAAYERVLVDGKTDESVGVKVQSFVKPLAQ